MFADFFLFSDEILHGRHWSKSPHLLLHRNTSQNHFTADAERFIRSHAKHRDGFWNYSLGSGKSRNWQSWLAMTADTALIILTIPDIHDIKMSDLWTSNYLSNELNKPQSFECWSKQRQHHCQETWWRLWSQGFSALPPGHCSSCGSKQAEETCETLAAIRGQHEDAGKEESLSLWLPGDNSFWSVICSVLLF